MKFGIFLPLQLPRPWEDDSHGRLFAEALEQAELADRLGYDYVWAQEHHFLEEYSHSSAPEVFLAAVSQRTRDIRIGHGVMLMPPAYNHPARCAERIATLDRLAEGRVEWGTGASGTRLELDAFGISATDKHAMWEEGLRTAVRLLAEQPFTGIEGRYVRMPPCNLVPKPMQRPHPPLWLACSSRETLLHAARQGMGALTFAFVEPEEAKHWVDAYYDQFATAADPIATVPNPNLAALSNFFCHQDGARAARLGRPGAEFFARGLAHYFQQGTHAPGESVVAQATTAERPFVDLHAFGTPEQLAQRYRRFEDAGVDQVILLQQAGAYAHDEICRSMELFAATVLPEFKSRESACQARKQQRLAEQRERLARPMPSAAKIAEGPSESSREVADTQATHACTSLADCASLVDLLRFRAAERPTHRALVDLDESGQVARTLSYAEWARAAASHAARISARVEPAQRVLVVGDSGAELLVALFAVMAAGAVAVPVPIPQPGLASDRWAKIVAAAEPALAVGSHAALATLAAQPSLASGLPMLAVDLTLPEVEAVGERPIADTAFVQYTSGSTRRPKGVPVTHAMAMGAVTNAAALFGFRSVDRFLTILPLHHTFGLFVHCLAALRAGASCYMLPPLALASDAHAWLRAISAHSITVSGAPNFAYARCARATESQASGLDLSSWRLALNGGEPPRAETLEAFAARFREHGFVRAALTPSYGLTEAAGTVSGSAADEPARLLQVDSESLRRGRVSRGAGSTLVSNGHVAAGLRLAVVDPRTHRRCAEGEIGEVWLAGETIAKSYLAAPDTEEAPFARIADEEGEPYLRTRDLGALLEGELYLTGRAQDVMAIRGENFFPADLEEAVRAELPWMEEGGVAAFGIEHDGSEVAALVVEVPSGAPLAADTLSGLRSALVRRLGIRPAWLCCVATGELPRSPIGKLKRSEARQRLLARSYTVLLEADDRPCAAAASGALTVEEELASIWCALLQRSEVPHDQSFFALGGDSLLAAEALSRVNARYGSKLKLADVVAHMSIASLAERVRADVRQRELHQHTEPAGALRTRFDEFELRLLTHRDVASAAHCLAAAFARLPMVAALAPEPHELSAFMTQTAHAAADERLSLALFEVRQQRLIGCGLCEDYATLVQAALPELPARLEAGVAIQAELDQRYIALAGMPDRALHLNLLALERGWEGRNLPLRMIEATLELAQARGYANAIAHAASPVVQRLLAEEFGFACVAVQSLHAYEYAGKKPFSGLPHASSLMLMTRPLAPRTAPKRYLPRETFLDVQEPMACKCSPALGTQVSF